MTPLFPAQRAAEEFDQVLSGTADDAVAARYAELFDAVEQLRALPEVTPRAEFVGDLRSRLMTAAETELVVAPTATLRAVPSLPEERTAPPQPPPRHDRCLARRRRRHRRHGRRCLRARCPARRSTRSSAASSRSPPPSASATPARARPCSTRPRPGSTRSARCRPRARPTPTWSPQTIDAFRTAADSGSAKLFASYQASGDQADITTVRDFTAAQMADVAAMSTGADTATNDLLLDAADTLADIDQQARVLCGTCAPSKPLAPPDALSAGAGAATHGQPDRPPGHPGPDRRRRRSPPPARPASRRSRPRPRAQAGEIPQLPAGTTGDGTTDYALPGTSGNAGRPADQHDHPRRQAAADGPRAVPRSTDLVSGVTEHARRTATGGATRPGHQAARRRGQEARRHRRRHRPAPLSP